MYKFVTVAAPVSAVQEFPAVRSGGDARYTRYKDRAMDYQVPGTKPVLPSHRPPHLHTLKLNNFSAFENRVGK